MDRIYSVKEDGRLDQKIYTQDLVSGIIEKHADMVKRICCLYLKNSSDADDVFQEVFLKFFLHADSLQDEQHQKAWLCRVTFNQCKDLCKSFWRKKVVSIEGMEIPYKSPEQDQVVEAVKNLPHAYKQIIYLHYYERWTVPEIAVFLKMNQNTVYTQLRRAKALLKKKVGDIQ